MKEGPDISRLATLLGDPARANIISALMAGLALTATELAREAGVTAQTASGHLAKLVEAGILIVEIQGRHRYFRIAHADVAATIEALTGLAARLQHLRTRPGPRDAAMRRARVCYDHLAGEIGVRLYDRLIEAGWLAATAGGLAPTAEGRDGFIAEGIAFDALAAKSRPLCRACLDWSERRPHLAGSIGKALLEVFLARGWVERGAGTRTLRLPPRGVAEMERFLKGLSAPSREPAAPPRLQKQ